MYLGGHNLLPLAKALEFGGQTVQKQKNENSQFKQTYSIEYNLFLYRLLRYTCISRNYIVASSESEWTAYRNIKRGLARKHIRENTVTEKFGYTSYKVTYYALTDEGVRYLADLNTELPNEGMWVKKLNLPRERFKIIGAATNSTKLYRYVAVSGSAVMASMIKAKTNPLFVTDTDIIENLDNISDNHLSKIISDTFSEMKGNGQKFSDYLKTDIDEKYFWNVYEIKSQLIQDDPTKSKEYSIGRYTGILESRCKSVLTYVGHKAGMAWSEKATKQERYSHHLYDVLHSRYKQLDKAEEHAVMFVENERMFADLYTDKKEKRRGRPFAENFDSFIIIPTNKNGISNLDLYMSINREEYENEIIHSAIDSGIYRANLYGAVKYFPLTTQNGIPVYLGLFIDAVCLNELIKITSQLSIIDYYILCYEWQAYYYRRVLPESVQYMILK